MFKEGLVASLAAVIAAAEEKMVLDWANSNATACVGKPCETIFQDDYTTFTKLRSCLQVSGPDCFIAFSYSGLVHTEMCPDTDETSRASMLVTQFPTETFYTVNANATYTLEVVSVPDVNGFEIEVRPRGQHEGCEIDPKGSRITFVKGRTIEVQSSFLMITVSNSAYADLIRPNLALTVSACAHGFPQSREEVADTVSPTLSVWAHGFIIVYLIDCISS
eukprot:Blabericola_migrator_1__2251@NODE_1621_length_4150_cov_156_413911_g1056_i0_p1_GENE_NODE_1621_length_4150_cov_156_413911_g1056_i0NODE_1621_length_4150_cov_156_413911_g1056_i0_p1_ORF_typecomplete_len220_score19_15_NODE_1621_length_4150_cov_156_413911_g1056_i017292388